VGDGWSYSALENSTMGGRTSYRSSPRDGWTYDAGACAALVSEPILLDPTAAPRLSYMTRFNLEQGWDGVVVEISDDGGQSWSDLPPGMGYPSNFGQTEPAGVPINGCGFPATRRAFNGPSGNGGLTLWSSWQSSLSAYAGSTIRLRFVLSTDPGVEYDGLYLDDISVSGVLLPPVCEPCTVPPAVGNTVYVARSADDVRINWTDVADAVSYGVEAALDPRFAPVERVLPAPDGDAGAVDLAAIPPPPVLLFYRVRGLGNCGDWGP
jgi:hypothetical protein